MKRENRCIKCDPPPPSSFGVQNKAHSLNEQGEFVQIKWSNFVVSFHELAGASV